MATTPTRQKTAPFKSPNGFHRVSEPPNTLTASVADCFKHDGGQGQIVVKKLQAISGESFWQVERWVLWDESYRRETTFAERSRGDVHNRICEEINHIRQ
ncbi:hypothetical protein Harman_38860 [Haloarcula mannanilytica]|uniref:Uncharacterized protein n=1 Tax=Haloarcula mannanilytica TaxID=2509225 RepID=A0A4C2EN56_9EURY|nr:hypothetical protein Harman_38860 [Haloarcula mannanilytica]